MGACSANGDEEPCTGYWYEIQRERDTLGRPRHRWEDNTKMDLVEIRRGSVDWVPLQSCKL
jgi:hypothetical protein